MPTAIADKIADKFIGHEVNLQRLQASQRLTMLKALRKLEDELEIKIQNHTRGSAVFTLERNKALLKEVRATIQTAYDGITETHQGMLKEMANYDLKTVGGIINKSVGATLFAVGVPEAVVKSLLDKNTIFGAPLKGYWEGQSVALQNRFVVTMRAGIFAGDTPYQLIQRVRGTKANGFKDGIMQASRNGAEVVVRTAAASVLNDARMNMYEGNQDVLNGVQALVTLDDRTSEICMARSGEAWDFEGNPLEGTDTTEDFPGPPPWHPNCRSTLVPIVKGFDQLIADKKMKKELNKLSESTQASMDGQVPSKLTYEEWLNTKDTAFQKEVLGEGRYALWQKGRISLRDLIDQRGRPLTLGQLQSM